MPSFEDGLIQATTPKPERQKKLTRAEVQAQVEKDNRVEGADLRDVHLVSLDLEGTSFRGSDVRGVVLYYPEEDGYPEARTNIQNTDWTDASFADTGATYFDKVQAQGATFGYTESLSDRRKRHQDNHEKTGKGPKPEDTGGLFGFNGSGGDFIKTKWSNVDFGGASGYEAMFPDADFSEAIIEASDLSGLDFSTAIIVDIKIKDPVSLQGMRINKQQIESVAQAIELSNQKTHKEFVEGINQKGSQKALEDFFGVVIV